METTGELCIGQFVSSKAGRDKDKVFIVIDIADDKHVLIADGDLRKIEKPKKKRVRHLQKYNLINEDIKKQLENGLKVENIFIRKEIEKISTI